MHFVSFSVALSATFMWSDSELRLFTLDLCNVDILDDLTGVMITARPVIDAPDLMPALWFICKLAGQKISTMKPPSYILMHVCVQSRHQQLCRQYSAAYCFTEELNQILKEQ